MNQEGLGKSRGPEEEHPSWPVTFDSSGNMYGLPEGISREDELLYVDKKGKLCAQKPSTPTTSGGIKDWRTDWRDFEGN